MLTLPPCTGRLARWLCGVSLAASALAQAPSPPPPGTLVDIGGGQRVHVLCSGHGSPAVVLEAGLADPAIMWTLVQSRVEQHTRVCSYDRGGYGWSTPGQRPRTFAQLALELHTALDKLGVAPPYVLVGQSYGGLVVRGFARQYPGDVAGMVLVDAVHEDEHVVYDGQPHLLRDQAQRRPFPAPRIAADSESLRAAAAANATSMDGADPAWSVLPPATQKLLAWCYSRPLLPLVVGAETDWSPEELVRFHDERVTNRATLGGIPLRVLARTSGGYDSGMSISADSLERERRALQADLAALSTRGTLVFAPHAGHNIQLDDPALVAQAILDVVVAASR